MFPSAYVVRRLLGGAESRQNEGNPALGSGLPSAPEQPGRAALGQGPGVSSDVEICDLFRSELGTKGRDFQE